MKNFQRVMAGVDVSAAHNAVMRNPDLWDQHTLRTTHPGTPHTEVSDIWLRFSDEVQAEAKGLIAGVIDEHESINFPAMRELPQLRPLIFGLMAKVEGERLGRVLVTKLKPEGKIEPHIDGGSHAAYYDRFHIVLHAEPNSLFGAGDETVEMRTGEIWWFDNSATHWVRNNSKDDRVHLIVDIRTFR